MKPTICIGEATIAKLRAGEDVDLENALLIRASDLRQSEDPFCDTVLSALLLGCDRMDFPIVEVDVPGVGNVSLKAEVHRFMVYDTEDDSEAGVLMRALFEAQTRRLTHIYAFKKGPAQVGGRTYAIRGCDGHAAVHHAVRKQGREP